MKNENVNTVMLNVFQHPHLTNQLYKEEEILNQFNEIPYYNLTGRGPKVMAAVQDDNRVRTSRGFTLIELLVVVLIIGILAAVAVPQYQKAVEKARMAEAITIVNNVEKAIDLYILQHGFPKEGTQIEFLGHSPHQNTEWSDPDTSYLNPGLDINIEDSLTCTYTPEDDAFCYSHNYAYHASCTSSGCSIGADRVSSPQGKYGEDPEDPYVLSGSTISSIKNNTQNSWRRTCGSSPYDNQQTINLTLCQSMWQN